MLAMLQMSSYSDIQCRDGNGTSTQFHLRPVREADSAETAPHAPEIALIGTWLQKAVTHKQTYLIRDCECLKTLKTRKKKYNE